MSYAIRALVEADMEPVRQWRNAQLDVLRQPRPLTREDQARYWRDVVEPLGRAARPQQVLRALELGGDLVGYGGLTNVDWDARRAELSFLVEPGRAGDPAVYAADMDAFLALVVDGLAFTELGLHRVFTETYDLRPLHVARLEAHGFAPEGRLRDHVRIDGRWVDSLLHGMLGPGHVER